MSSPQNLAAGFAATVLLITLSGCASNAQRQLFDVDATCKQARSDTELLRQLAITEGNTSADPGAAPRACKTANTISMDSTRHPHPTTSAM